MSRIWLASPVALLLVVACSPARPDATTPKANIPMSGMKMGNTAPAPGDSDATAKFKNAMITMMETAPAFTNDADVDFMMQMRGHHQSAIAMAEVELSKGQDPEARALAKSIIGAQKAEIEQIRIWLQKKAR